MATAAELKHIPLGLIEVGERFRQDYGGDAFNQLKETIAEKGVLQPITVAPVEGGKFKLLAGGRRTKAAQDLGMLNIPALVRVSEGEIDDLEIELIENVFRLDMHWAERDRLIARLHEVSQARHGSDWSGRKTAQLLGTTKTSVARSLQMAKAIELIPELAQQETRDAAEKIMRHLEGEQITQELRRRQQAKIAEADVGGRHADYGVSGMLKIADANYRIGDVFKGLEGLRDNGVVHLIECDPPYGIDLNEQKRGNEDATSTVRSYNEIPTKEYSSFLDEIATELYRVAGPHCWLVFWYGPTWHTQVLEALRKAGWVVDDIPCIWSKKSGQTMQPAYHFARTYEPFFLARKGTPAIIRQGRSNVFDFPPVAGQKKYHPTQRPLDLMENIIEVLVAPNSVILVPFAGSGVTLRAAYKAGCSAMGWDLNGEYKDKFMLAVEEDTRELNAPDTTQRSEEMLLRDATQGKTIVLNSNDDIVWVDNGEEDPEE